MNSVKPSHIKILSFDISQFLFINSYVKNRKSKNSHFF